MELLRLSTGLLLPWLGGAVWLMFAESGSRVRPNRLRQAGYGFFLGYAMLFCLIMAADWLTGRVSWGWLTIALGVIAASGAAAFWLAAQQPLAGPAPQPPLGMSRKVLLAVLATWVGLHLAFVTVEILNLPLHPWDAWVAWVYRAKVWFVAGGLVDVVGPREWADATTAAVYTIEAAEYPLLASIIPYWTALSLGRWSDTLINLPVLLAAAAMGLAIYGQCRESGFDRLVSFAACYLVFSVPLFITHIALAGYADIWMAGFAGLGFLALVRGAAFGQVSQRVLGLLLVALSMFVKNEGVVWLLAAALLWLLTAFRWRTVMVAALAIAGVMWVGFAWFDRSHIDLPYAGMLGVVDGRFEIPFVGSFMLEMHDIWPAYADNFFALGSWNLLWLLVAVSLLVAVVERSPFPAPARRAGGTFIVIFLLTQLFIFGFTDQGAWADTYTAINRLPLQFLPALVYASFVIIHERMSGSRADAEIEQNNV